MSIEPIEIEKLEVSSRLKNCMRRSGISDLRDIVRIQKESIFRFAIWVMQHIKNCRSSVINMAL